MGAVEITLIAFIAGNSVMGAISLLSILRSTAARHSS